MRLDKFGKVCGRRWGGLAKSKVILAVYMGDNDLIGVGRFNPFTTGPSNIER